MIFITQIVVTNDLLAKPVQPTLMKLFFSNRVEQSSERDVIILY